MWHVSSRSGVATLRTAIHLLLTYLHIRLTAIFSGATWMSRYQKGNTYLDFTEAIDSEWQWHQLGHMQVCTLLQTDNHTNTRPLCFLQAGCPSCRQTNSIKALKAKQNRALIKVNVNCAIPVRSVGGMLISLP